jgi:hypothetical protein
MASGLPMAAKTREWETLGSLDQEKTIRRKALPSSSVQTMLPSPDADNGRKSEQEVPHLEGGGRRLSKGKLTQNIHRIGLLSILILTLGTAVMLGTIAFLSYLWFSGVENATWHEIVVTNWVTRSVTLSALVLATVTVLQTGVFSSLLAGIIIEDGRVLTGQLAKVSISRSTSDLPYGLCQMVLTALFKRRISVHQTGFLSLLLVLLITNTGIHFVSTILVSDLSLYPIMGMSEIEAELTNYVYSQNSSGSDFVTRGSSWVHKPAFYPVFAENSNSSSVTTNQSQGFSDTGPILRAFLPYQEQQARYNIQDYRGRATVLDARVVCMEPNLPDPYLFGEGGLSYTGEWGDTYLLTTRVWPSILLPSITSYNVTQGNTSPTLLNQTYFGCSISVSQSSQTVWRLAICQIAQDSGLKSTFSSQYGPAYLVLNVTTGDSGDWSQLTAQDPLAPLSGGFQPVSQAGRGEWLDLDFRGDGSAVISVSLCFPAFDTADLAIHASAPGNRSEPSPVYDISSSKFVYDKIRRQLGQATTGSFLAGDFDERGILELETRPSWIVGENPNDYSRPLPGPGFPHSGRLTNSWVLNGCKFEGPLGTFQGQIYGTSVSVLNNSPATNFTAIFDNEVSMPALVGNIFSIVNASTTPAVMAVDPSYASLAQEILHHGGDIAHALQSLITVAAASYYYDQLPQFTGLSEVQQTSFVLVVVPRKYRGYVTTIALVFTHLLLGVVVVCWFFKRTEISSVGNSWQCVAQIAYDENIQRLLGEGTLATDREMMEKISAPSAEAGRDESPSISPNDLVGIMLDESGDKTRVFFRR